MYKKKMEGNLCIYSYNSRGFDCTKQDILKTLISLSGDNLPIICNQENFLLKANGYMAKKCLPDHQIFFKPATKKDLNGRPKNGMFIAIPSCLKESAEEISSPSPRVQSVLIDYHCNKTLLTNTYFPQDPLLGYKVCLLTIIVTRLYSSTRTFHKTLS